MQSSYTIAHVPGFSGNDHLGREIATELVGRTFPTLTSARTALKLAKADKALPPNGHVGRFDIIRDDGRRSEWQ